jgi:hypothetical protein
VGEVCRGGGGGVGGRCTYAQGGLSLKVRVRTRRGRGQFLPFFCVRTKWTTPSLERRENYRFSSIDRILEKFFLRMHALGQLPPVPANDATESNDRDSFVGCVTYTATSNYNVQSCDCLRKL